MIFSLDCKLLNRSGSGAIKVRQVQFLSVFTFTKWIWNGKVRLRSKVSSSNFYGPGARDGHLIIETFLTALSSFPV